MVVDYRTHDDSAADLAAPRRRRADLKRRAVWPLVFGLAISPLVAGLLMVGLGPDGVVVDIGGGLIGGALIGLIFAIVQYAIDRRNQQQDTDADLRLLLSSTPALGGIDLSGRSLTGVFLRNKDLKGARLAATDLTSVDLQGTVLDGAVLDRAVLTGAIMVGSHAKGADFSFADLAGSDLTGAHLADAVMLAVRARGAAFRTAHLVGADLSRSDLTDAGFEGANLDGAFLIGVDAGGVRMTGSTMRNAVLSLGNFQAAEMARVTLVGANLTGADFTGAMLSRSKLTQANLSGANFTGANLTGASLAGSEVGSANFTGAVLIGCDLSGVDLSRADLTDVVGSGSARTDAATRWPNGQPPANIARQTPLTPLPSVGRSRRVSVTAVGPDARRHARAMVADVVDQQERARRYTSTTVFSLPLTVRPPREIAIGLRSSGLPVPSGVTDQVQLAVTGPAGSREIVVTIRRRAAQQATTTFSVPVDGRPTHEHSGRAYPTVTEELVAQVLNVIDPRDRSGWRARVHFGRAVRAAADGGDAGMRGCRDELAAAHALDPFSPVVNYALGALDYNEYDEAATDRAITRFGVAYASRRRISDDMIGLKGLILTGYSLCHSQLYHRFGRENHIVLASARTSARMALSTAEERVGRRDPKSVRRTAQLGLALATYAVAFAEHVTELRSDVESSIPKYEAAIGILTAAGVPVPATLYNNLGYQHMTLGGRTDAGTDRERYELARAQFEKATQVAPNFHFGWTNLGNVHRLLNDLTAAEGYYRHSIMVAEHNGARYPAAWNELARTLLELGDVTAAADSHEKAVSLAGSAPTRARLMAEYGQGLLLVGRNGDAAVCAQRGLTEDPGNVHCRRTLAEATGV